ncbi:hypothetical protein BGX26_001684 [Mortierella sp. AD094]|nr:hypothetical protein BGX26_001684 [Mortierella sp. AD094]
MFQLPAVINFFSIPELLELIHSYLSTSDIIHCSKVSKAFSEIFTPLLWHTISLRTEAQHRYFTENPEVQAALLRNGKYIRVIQVETFKSLIPFLNVDADLLKNIHTLQLPCSIDYDEGYPDITYSNSSHVDAMQAIKRLETNNTVPLRVSDWLQEKDVFLMYHGIALRMLRVHQLQSEQIRNIKLEMLVQTVDLAQQQLDASRRFLSGPISLLQLEADSIDSTDSSLSAEEEALLRDVQTLCDKTKKRVTAFSGTRLLESHSEVISTLTEKLEKSGLRFLSLVYSNSLSLDCTNHTNHTKYLGRLLDNCPLQLETLRVSGTVSFTPPSTQGPNSDSESNSSNNDMSTTRSNTSRPTKTRIKQLLLEGNAALRIRPLFLNQCPELRSLSLSAYSDETLKIAADCIGEHCPLLEDLAIIFVETEINPSYIVSLLESCSAVDPQSMSHLTSSGSSLLDQETLLRENQTLIRRVGLKKLMLCGISIWQQQDLVVDALCRHHSPTLTHLAIKSCSGTISDRSALGDASIQKILKSFKKLEHMEFTVSGNIPAYWIHVNHVNASAFDGLDAALPFAATLRVLRIMIDGIFRSASPPIVFNISPHDPSLAIETQVKVCQILGSLTALEELALGVDEDDGPLVSTYSRWGYQFSCLELTLETGLCSMSELKRLRVFKVTRMNHRIGLKELEWMCESWPRLKEIRGLLGYQPEVLCRLDNDTLSKDTDVGCEMLDWVEGHRPRLRCT